MNINQIWTNLSKDREFIENLKRVLWEQHREGEWEMFDVEYQVGLGTCEVDVEFDYDTGWYVVYPSYAGNTLTDLRPIKLNKHDVYPSYAGNTLTDLRPIKLNKHDMQDVPAPIDPDLVHEVVYELSQQFIPDSCKSLTENRHHVIKLAKEFIVYVNITRDTENLDQVVGDHSAWIVERL